MHDFLRDWRRWTPAERAIATALVALAVLLVPTLLVVTGHAS